MGRQNYMTITVADTVQEMFNDFVSEKGMTKTAALNDVLEMARIESGKYIMDETVTDIREFDRSICDVFENQLEQKGIRSVFL